MASYNKTYSMVQDWQKPFQRQKPYPLDSTSIFSTYEDAVAYAKGDGSDAGKLGGAAYVGQIITVYENSSVGVYKIEEDRTLAAIGGTDTLEVTYYEDLKEIAKIKLGQLVKVKDVKVGDSHLAGFYIYNGVSFDYLAVSTGATDEVAALKSKIEVLEGKIDGLEGDIYVITDGEKSYTFYTKTEVDTLVTTALSDYVLGTTLTETLRGYVTTGDLNTALLNKVDKTSFETFQNTVSGTYATKTELTTGLNSKADSTHNHDDKYASLTEFNGLKEAMGAQAGKYFLKSLGDSSNYSASYQLWQKVGEVESVVEGSSIINIPKDMVVSAGEIVTDPEGQEPGTYIKLTLANATNDTLYIPVSKLIDVYTAGDNYIAVNGYAISLNIETVANAVADQSALTLKFVDKTTYNADKEATENAYKLYADGVANTAKTDAIAHTDTELLKYTTSDIIQSTYVDKETYGQKVQSIEGSISTINGNIENITNAINNETSGNAALLNRINATDANLVKTDEAVAKNAQDINSINGNIETLGNSVVKTVVIGSNTYTPTTGTITIGLAPTISNEHLNSIPSVKAVQDALSTINTNIDNRTTIKVVAEMPSVENASENVIYISGSEGSRSEQILIGDKFYEFGSDTYARKDVYATSHSFANDGSILRYGSNGLMTADDKTKLDGIISITELELKSILEVQQ
jgi:hypothetical protein